MTGFENETITPVYWPAGIFAKVPRKRESDCKRMRSTTGKLLSVRACCVPAELTRAIPVMVTLNVKREGLAGRVSATMVRLTVPVPEVQVVQTVPGFGPLQELTEMATSKRMGRNKRVLMRFMWHPTTELSAFASWNENAQNPRYRM
jgi:hypothetical protein